MKLTIHGKCNAYITTIDITTIGLTKKHSVEKETKNKKKCEVRKFRAIGVKMSRASGFPG